ncbi:MAG: preprotein translocase subunit YajC [Gammaproteobacteria bacterium]|nr:preprotein translocase subunit YajC [Gammaproteobacteria bacterium]
MSIFLSFIGIADAFAAAAPAQAAGGQQSWGSLIPMFAILILFMYFMIIRPQTKRAKEHKNLVSGLKKGDEVMTVGGILGKIEKITDNFIVLSIAENTNITVQKSAVSNTLPKGTIKSI